MSGVLKRIHLCVSSRVFTSTCGAEDKSYSALEQNMNQPLACGAKSWPENQGNGMDKRLLELAMSC
uniref:Uncharacterized protein n=1 Tax=Anguilla anguilla TaxID=7936 RepID=A0A0E9SHI4_ANGAN